MDATNNEATRLVCLEAAQKLRTYAGIYTGDKQACRLVDELTNIALAAATQPQAAMPDLAAALRKAYNYGQTYWQQADSEYLSQQKKSNETADKFAAFVAETVAAFAAAPPSPQPVAESVKQLMKFYSASTLEELAEMQAKHIERLQTKLPTVHQPAFTRVREG